MPRPDLRFCIPFNEALETENGWRTRDEKHTTFVSCRFHFAAFRKVDQNPIAFYGEPVDTILPKQGVKTATELGVKYTLQITDTYKTIENSLTESTALAGISAELAGQIGVPNVASTGSKLASQIQASMRTQFSQGFELSRSEVTTQEISYKQSFAFDDANPKSREALICPTYKKVYFDLHLTHLDFLKVEYLREFFGLRKKRKKVPQFPSDGRPFNLIKVMQPLFAVQVWQLNQSLAVKWRGEEFRTVDDPFVTAVVPPVLSVTPALDFVARPSLYQLANAAFPTRWVKRKGRWTEEDLRKSELDEAQDSAWFWQYGQQEKATGNT